MITFKQFIEEGDFDFDTPRIPYHNISVGKLKDLAKKDRWGEVKFGIKHGDGSLHAMAGDGLHEEFMGEGKDWTAGYLKYSFKNFEAEPSFHHKAYHPKLKEMESNGIKIISHGRHNFGDSPNTDLKEDFDWTPSPKAKSVDIGKANIQYTVNPDNTGNIKLIGVEPKDRGKGHARKALGQFLQQADQRKTTMYLDAVQMGYHKSALDKGGLEGFYKSVGFRKNGKTATGDDREFVRKPR